MRRLLLMLALVPVACSFTPAAPVSGVEDLERSLRAAETAFAQTMADRDLAAFTSFVAEDAVFSSPRASHRGRTEIVAAWSRYFEGAQAPFAWRPERVHVRARGSLGATTGPVFDPAGKVVGQFVSTWERQADGRWLVVLDVGPDCRCPQP